MDLAQTIDYLLIPMEGRIISAVCVGEKPFPIEDIGNMKNDTYRRLFDDWCQKAMRSGWIDNDYNARVTFHRNHLSYMREDTGSWYFAISTEIERTLH